MAIATKIVLIMEYDGTRYYGFQLQADLPTIQGETEKALSQLSGEKIRVIAASRTDTGVHAKGQVASFITESPLPVPTFVKGLNYYLPRDIAVKMAYRVENSFDVRRMAVSREYSYYILNSTTRSPIRQHLCYLVSRQLDIDAMNGACRQLVGERNFASFTTRIRPVPRSFIRKVIRAEVARKEDLVIFNMEANSFLPHQVRNTVGTLIRVGLGKMSIADFYSIIEAKTPGLAGPTVPARGLCLMRVNYPHPFGGDN